MSRAAVTSSPGNSNSTVSTGNSVTGHVKTYIVDLPYRVQKVICEYVDSDKDAWRELGKFLTISYSLSTFPFVCIDFKWISHCKEFAVLILSNHHKSSDDN
jgi:hypothetical protein